MAPPINAYSFPKWSALSIAPRYGFELLALTPPTGSSSEHHTERGSRANTLVQSKRISGDCSNRPAFEREPFSGMTGATQRLVGGVSVSTRTHDIRHPKITGEVTGEATGEVERLVLALEGRMSRVRIQQASGLRHEDHFRAKYLIPALQSGFVEMTNPDRPKSSRQQYRLTAKAEALRAKLLKEK